MPSTRLRKYQLTKGIHKRMSKYVVGIGLIGTIVAVLFLFSSALSPSPQQVETSAPPNYTNPLIATGEWPEYKSTIGRYSIKYPPNWEPVEGWSDNGGIVFRLREPLESQEQLLIGVSRARIPQGWSLDQTAREKIAMVGATEIKVNSLTVDGIDAIELIGMGEMFHGIQIISISKGAQFTFWVEPIEPDHPKFGHWADPMTYLFHTMIDTFEIQN